MSQLAESKGLILSSRNYKEKDKLVKIFTESSGKMMFYIKGIHRQNQPLAPALLPFTEAVYIGNFRSEGLSFLSSVKDVHAFRHIQEDIFLSGYGTYLLNLVDAAIEDHQYDPHLFQFTQQALQRMDQGDDAEIITNIFEVQILQRFGIAPIWTHCVVCGETKVKFDYSSKYGGVICERHWSMDDHRYHADPRAVYFVRMFSAISYDKISGIHLKEETKQAIRELIDQLYDEYVGIHLKSKKFIDQMKSWAHVLKTPEKDQSKKEKETPEKEE
ncbi:DNA repair protein RecO [Enterococcus faecium]|uniref:DNA repair protein RecO n=1 Tax=Enterococcus faecium TaxID=1352 RepID=UPI000CF6415B|nr:DNA repair protein RecO [Enterococcus faecium]EMF0598726.1 DNA repair protein RecO [Enterococcus faecium]MDT2359346.1 DNA repair protein RecO [Enterococcus faecium]MDV4934547.1 DNA repair protein RecO [Enterococcus faecium]PQB35432.1 DNA repair protein RecO [Enterococcus faecium]